jgi:hypothetical protein
MNERRVDAPVPDSTKRDEFLFDGGWASASLEFFVLSDLLYLRPPKRKLRWKFPDGSLCSQAIALLRGYKE